MLNADFHVHTVMSGHAFCTFNECAAAACEKGLSVIAITDHGPAMQGSVHEGYFEMSPRLPKQFGSLVVLFGCEANIVNTRGELDLSDNTMSGLDIVLAGLHKKTPYLEMSEANNTKAIVSAIERNACINIVSHPFRAEFPVSIIDVTFTAIEHHVLLEINTHLIEKAIGNYQEKRSRQVIENTAKMVEILQGKNKGYVINSDAHHTSEIGISDDVLEKLKNILGISEEYILNNNLELLSNYIPALRKWRCKM